MSTGFEIDMSAEPGAVSHVLSQGLDPIDYLRAHHRLQLSLCNLLECLSSSLHHCRAAEFAEMAVRYLEDALPMHHEDEARDLREALELQPGFEPEDSLLFDLVEEGHWRDRELADPVLDGLTLLASGSFPTAPSRFVLALLQFAESLRRHVMWEERVIIPLAAERLSPQARAGLLACMLARRNATERRNKPAA